MNDKKEGFLIDGFPRQLDQAIQFEKEIGLPKFVLYYDCNLSTLERRLLKRSQTSGRTDDNTESIRKRFDTFYQVSYPVVDYYVKKSRCFVVNNGVNLDFSRRNYRRSLCRKFQSF